MYFTEHQKQFWNEYQGKTLPVGYRELAEAWRVQNQGKIAQLSETEQQERLTLYMQEHIQRRIDELIDQRDDWSPDEKGRRHKQAFEGKIILASSDDGRHFDQLILPEQVDNVDKADELLLLSSSLREATTREKMREVMEEQIIVRLSSNLEQPGPRGEVKHRVKQASIKADGRIQLDIEKSDGSFLFAEVDVNAPQMKYVFKDPHTGKQEGVQAINPEEYGEIQADPNLRPLTQQEEKLDRYETLQNRKNQEAAIAGSVALIALDEEEAQIQAENEQRQRIQLAAAQSLAPPPQDAPRAEAPESPASASYINVQAAKARVARQRQAQEQRSERIQTRYKRQAQEEQKRAKQAYEAKREAQAQAAQKRRESRQSFARRSGLGVAVSMGLVGLMTSGALFVNTIVQQF